MLVCSRFLSQFPDPERAMPARPVPPRTVLAADIARVDLKACQAKVRVGMRLIAGGLTILLIQGIVWIEQGTWSPCDLQSVVRWLGLRLPASNWQGVQAVVDWLLAFPLSALPLVVGFSVAWSGAARADRAGKDSELEIG
jgi:hypothetical protein